MPMITKATADKRFRVVAMMRFKAKAFKAFRKITGQCAWRFFLHPLKNTRYDWLIWLTRQGMRDYFLRFLNEFPL